MVAVRLEAQPPAVEAACRRSQHLPSSTGPADEPQGAIGALATAAVAGAWDNLKNIRGDRCLEDLKAIFRGAAAWPVLIAERAKDDFADVLHVRCGEGGSRERRVEFVNVDIDAGPVYGGWLQGVSKQQPKQRSHGVNASG